MLKLMLLCLQSCMMKRNLAEGLFKMLLHLFLLRCLLLTQAELTPGMDKVHFACGSSVSDVINL